MFRHAESQFKDEKYMADRHMAEQHMAEQYTTTSEEDTPQTLEKAAPEGDATPKIVLKSVSENRTVQKTESIRPILAAFPIEFVILTTFCLLNHYLASVLKVHGYSLNLYLTKIVTTAMSMLFGN